MDNSLQTQIGNGEEIHGDFVGRKKELRRMEEHVTKYQSKNVKSCAIFISGVSGKSLLRCRNNLIRAIVLLIN